jgi:UDP-N-acetylmuramoylalanine--D-glutamate ligase
MNIEGKKISIIGAVRSGVAAAKLAKKMNAVPFISDMANEEQLADSIEVLIKEGIEYEIGSHSDKVYECDLMVTSPGVPSDSRVLKEAAGRNIKIISELEFASYFCRGNVISITGTNGKTTTTSLCAHTLNACGFKCHLAGNIGVAFSDITLDVEENDFVALETSSFQLDHIEKFHPNISVILNITPDHLDRYENDFETYMRSKLNVGINQTGLDYIITNADDYSIPQNFVVDMNNYHFSLTSPVDRGSYFEDSHLVFTDGEITDIVCSSDDLSLYGEHNTANALAVLTIAKIIGCKNNDIKLAFSSFPGVEHRMEFTREINGVGYFNDSKATNVDAVWYALRSFTQPILLILGGKDKGNDYSKIKELVITKVKRIYAVGSSADKVHDFFCDHTKVDIIPTLEECVIKSAIDAENGDIVLLSPACASFDMFDNYEHRGNVFKEAVGKLS